MTSRNCCIIAHVDHGKTTVCDSLLGHAQLINQHRAGNVRELDCDAQEIERGITINSTGVTLVYHDWELAKPPVQSQQHQHQESSLASDGDSVYIGNLPFEQDALEAALSALLRESAGAAVAALSVNEKRGFAVATFASPEDASAVLKRAREAPLELGGRALVVEPHGASAALQLAAAFRERGWDAPRFETVNADADDATAAADKVVAVTVPASDPSSSSPTTVRGAAPTLKEAKRRAAEAALALLSSGSPAAEAAVAEEAAQATSGLTVNLIDCPGHVDFSGEVTAALRITDGAVVVVDPFDSKVEGQLCVQTETVLRQALQERVKPILLFNKIDKGILGLQLPPEDLYRRLVATMDAVNSLIEMYQPKGFDFTVDPAKGNVLFASGLMGWAFSLSTIASLLAHKSNLGEDKLRARLWGENYFDPAAKKWTRAPISASSGKPLKRSFVTHVLEPIYRIFSAADEDRRADLLALAGKLNLGLKPAALADTLSCKDILTNVMRAWLPAAPPILRAIEIFLPSPQEAQRYRAVPLYEGDSEDDVARAMAACDSSGPTMVYVSKMVAPEKGSKTLLAYGRVFSGVLRVGDSVRVMDADYEPGQRCPEAKVRSIVLLMAGRTKSIHEARAGAIVGILGVSDFLTKSGTLSNSPAAHRMKVMRFTVSPVVRLAVRPAKASASSDLTKLKKAMRMLAQSDPTVLCFEDADTGQCILAGAGELHLEVRLRSLSELANIQLEASNPVVQYCETVTAPSRVCLAKSSNGHNRLFVTAQPLSDELVNALEASGISMATEVRERTEVLVQHGDLTRDEAKKVVAIFGTVVLVNMTTGVDISPIRDNVLIGLRGLVDQGVLAAEQLRGVRFNITDAKIHADSVHHRADQIVPMARRAFSAAVLCADPRVLEPIFRVEVQVDRANLSSVCEVLRRRGGSIVSDTTDDTGELHTVLCHLPVADSFGFNGELRGVSHGRAFSVVAFSHWSIKTGNPLDGASPAASVVRETRIRKRMAPDVPPLERFLDRL